VSSSLPLTLISFNGYQADERINLAWKTENEINTSQFQIERGADGFNFGRIGAVDAAGSGDHAYAFTDNAMQSGVNYYRLKMIDGDGQFSYSKVILFRSGNTINDEWKLWPNPVKNILSVSRSGSSAAVINVYNSYGQKVITQPVFNFTSDINFSGLPSGLYSLQIISEGRTIIKKIIKK